MSSQAEAVKQVLNAIREYIDEMDKRITDARTYEVEQAIALGFVEAFPEPEEGSSYPDVRTSFTLDSGTVRALMVNRDYTSLKDVTEHLKWLAARLGRYVIEDFPELGRRSYIFNSGRFRLQCFFHNTEANVCKFVQVGVEEKPIYKLMCGEQEVIAEEPAAVA